jgi:hypothetical protein
MDTSQLDTAELYRLLETVEDPTARYHIRNAIQYAIALEEHGRVGPQPIQHSGPDPDVDSTPDPDPGPDTDPAPDADRPSDE